MNILHLEPRYLPFDLEKTLDCGQVFTWQKNEDTWNGIIDDKYINIRQNGFKLFFNGIEPKELVRYFNLELDLTEVICSIKDSIFNFTGGDPDPIFEGVGEKGQGLRIIRQDPWECLVSFICSQNSNIPAIQKRITMLCTRYGKPLPGDRYAFPKPEDLAGSDLHDLCLCSTGYRASYLSETSNFIFQNPGYLSGLAGLSMKDARKELMNLPGVGPKVADCVLLFAYNHYQTVPVDVWIRSIITRRYPQIEIRSCGKKKSSYDDIADFCRDYFGIYAGYAQQYLFAARLDLK